MFTKKFKTSLNLLLVPSVHLRLIAENLLLSRDIRSPPSLLILAAICFTSSGREPANRLSIVKMNPIVTKSFTIILNRLYCPSEMMKAVSEKIGVLICMEQIMIFMILPFLWFLVPAILLRKVSIFTAPWNSW